MGRSLTGRQRNRRRPPRIRSASVLPADNAYSILPAADMLCEIARIDPGDFRACDIERHIRWATDFYIRDKSQAQSPKKFRNDLRTFRRNIDRFLRSLPDEHS